MSKACIWLREYLFTAPLISGYKLIGSCKDFLLSNDSLHRVETYLWKNVGSLTIPVNAPLSKLIKPNGLTWFSWQASCVKEGLLCPAVAQKGWGHFSNQHPASWFVVVMKDLLATVTCTWLMISIVLFLSCSFYSKDLPVAISLTLSCSWRRMIWAYWVKEAREKKHDLVLTKFVWELVLGSFVKGPAWFFGVDRTIQTKLQ